MDLVDSVVIYVRKIRPVYLLLYYDSTLISLHELSLFSYK